MQNIYLGLSDGQKIPSGYCKYIWTSQGCIEGIEWCRKHAKNYEILPSCWNSDFEIRQRFDYLYAVKERLISHCKNLLNEYHKTDYSEKQWAVFLNDWMQEYIVSYYEKYLKLKQIADMGLECDCLIYDTSKYVTAGYLYLEDDRYHCYQYSQLLALLDDTEIFHTSSMGDYEIKHIEQAAGRKEAAKVKILRWLFNYSKFITRKKDKTVILCGAFPGRLLAEAKLKDRRITSYYYDCTEVLKKAEMYPLDMEWRNQNEEAVENADEFTSVLIRLLRISLPKVCLEGFRLLSRTADKYYKYAMNANAVFYDAYGCFIDKVFMIYLMRMKNTDAKFYGIQHGGNYGIETTWTLRNEYETADYFCSWGWSGDDSYPCIFKPMPAPKLMKMPPVKAARDKNKILYVSYTNEKYIKQIGNARLFYVRDRKSELSFLQNISDELKKKMTVRPYKSDLGWHVKEHMEKAAPGLKIENDKEYYEALGEVNLVVTYDWSTTTVEALYAGKAILVRRDQVLAEYFALPDLEDMMRAGIVVSDFEQLGRQLEMIKNDIDAWWKEPGRQKVVKRIKDKYAYCPDNWKEIWMREFMAWKE